MSEYFVLLISTALVNNVVMARFLGLCPFMGVSRKIDSALGMGLATSFVIMLAAAITWILEHWLLAPLGLGYLRILAFILVIAAVVQFTEAVIHKMAPALYQTDALVGAIKQIHSVIREACTGCGNCVERCPTEAATMKPVPVTLQHWVWPKPATAAA